MKLIPITGFDPVTNKQGFVKGYFQVDDDDFPELSKHKYHLDRYGYVLSRSLGGKRSYVHRYLLGNPTHGVVDHIDRNPLNNQRSNLRVLSKAENAANTGLTSQNVSGVKGVSWMASKKKWRARIRANGKDLHLGMFDTKEKAIEARNIAAKAAWGDAAFIQ